MKRTLVIAALVIVAIPLSAQKKPLTFEAIFDPTEKVAFSGAIQSGFDWVDDNSFIWPRKDEKGESVEWRLFDVTSGKERALFDRAKCEHALAAAGLAGDLAKKAAASDSLTFDAKKQSFLVEASGDLYLYSIARGTAARLTSTPAKEEEPSFSPDGRKVAFVRENDLYVVDVESGRERRLTTDGGPAILNGKLDYVYQEEVYGRGIWKSYWWSPDSGRIAFLQLDERPVPKFTIVDHIPYDLDVNVYDYPQAGDPNPGVALFVVRASGGEPVKIDNERYSSAELLMVNVDWTPDGTALTYQVQNREQTWLDLDSASPADGKGTTLFRETTKAWVDPIANPTWLSDGTFLWQSERSGFRHIYLYKADGTLVRQVTDGEWEVRNLHGAADGYVYFSGTERSPIGLDVYRAKLDGTGLERLSDAGGTHTATFSPSKRYYIDKWSDFQTPDQIRVYGKDGKMARLVDENRVAALAEYDFTPPELLHVSTRDGGTMDAAMIRPPNFDPSKKYPVFQYLYGGPHAQTVVNRWGGQRGLFHQLLAHEGVIVWLCDNRTASGKGAVSTWPIYKHFGELELRDIEDGMAWLKKQPYVDGSRIMLSGWSYGGFMVSYALTHSTTFAAGIAGGTVADWRDYDSIYTERYMLMPQNNPDGYRNSSPRFAAKDLHGDLLLIHGTTDDNVHVQNTLQFAWDLQQAGKPFEMMLYPRTKHSPRDKKTVAHIQRMMFEFVKKELGR